MYQPKICVVGASNLDLISYVPRLPKVGETIHGNKFQMGFGGKGANQAVMAAKLGAEVSIITKLGRDPFGENTYQNFKHWGVLTESVFFTEQAFSGVAPIAVDPAGDNAIIIVTGANDLLTREEIESSRSVISSAQVLICQLEIPLEISLKAMQIARQSGVLTILNPAPARSVLPEELYSLSDLFCPNETETELLTGLPVSTLNEAEIAARTLLERGVGEVILTLGARGCLLVNNYETFHIPAEQVKPVDTTGAGDAFVGSLAYFIAAGQLTKVAMQKANQISAISVQSLGTQTSFPVVGDLPSTLFS